MTPTPGLPPPRTTLLRRADGVAIEYLATGSGDPVTLFVPGLGGSIPDTRPLGSGVSGRKVFLHLRGHGRSTPPGARWRYADLADDVAAVADATAARRALGVSMGAGALCRLVAAAPDRFTRLVLFLPAVLDVPRPASATKRLKALAAAIASGSPTEVAPQVAAEIPAGLRQTEAARRFIADRTRTLLAADLAEPVANLADEVALPDATALRWVAVPALVLACRSDELHPVSVAERLAELLPSATLHVYDEPGVLWTQRADLRRRISQFLTE